MKKGDKLKIIDDGVRQTTIPVGEICTYIKAFENYVCVFFDGREMLVNKNIVKPVD
mgnify:CR=1 FL=1